MDYSQSRLRKFLRETRITLTEFQALLGQAILTGAALYGFWHFLATVGK